MIWPHCGNSATLFLKVYDRTTNGMAFSITFVGPTELSVTQYYNNIFDDVSGKAAAGFNTTITDYWGRGLSYQFVNASDGGPSANMILNDSYQLLKYNR